MLVGATLVSRVVAAVEPVSLEAVEAVAVLAPISALKPPHRPAVKLPREIAAKRQLFTFFIFLFMCSVPPSALKPPRRPSICRPTSPQRGCHTLRIYVKKKKASTDSASRAAAVFVLLY